MYFQCAAGLENNASTVYLPISKNRVSNFDGTLFVIHTTVDDSHIRLLLLNQFDQTF